MALITFSLYYFVDNFMNSIAAKMNANLPRFSLNAHLQMFAVNFVIQIAWVDNFFLLY